jgi:hypothetical protein
MSVLALVSVLVLVSELVLVLVLVLLLDSEWWMANGAFLVWGDGRSC